MNYSDNYLSSDLLRRDLNTDTFLTTKFTPWEYEREYRYIAPKAGRFHFTKKALKEVIFGLRLKADDKEAFRLVFERSFQWVLLSEIRVTADQFAFEKVNYSHP